MQAQNQIECTAPGNCNGWLYHKNKIGIGFGSGIQLKDNGNVQVGSGITRVNIGKSYSNAPYYLSSYIGFNAQRNNQGQWLLTCDDVNNGGSALINDVSGNLRIVTYRPTQGTTTATLSESELMANTPLLITSNKKIGLRTTNINADADVQIKGTTYVEDKMGIGICLGANNNPKGYRFAVNGTMEAKDVYIEVDETPWPDYVFEPKHRLMPLSDLEWYINKNKHLPNIPSASDIKENGLSLAEINAQLVKKVEELTLYIIELNKKIRVLQKSHNFIWVKKLKKVSLAKNHYEAITIIQQFDQCRRRIFNLSFTTYKRFLKKQQNPYYCFCPFCRCNFFV